MKSLKITSAAVACLAMTPLAAMASATWQMWDNTSPVACTLTSGTSTSMGNSYGCGAVSSSDPTMSVTGWSTTGSGSSFAAASVQRWNWTSVSGTPVTMAGQTTGYDYGVVNAQESGSSPNHALDNYGNTDVLALNFTNKAVALTSVSLGWYNTDADISILRYTGNTAPNIVGKTISDLIASGWELVGHYANLQDDATSPVRTAEIKNANASSWWLISAFNSGYGKGTTTYGGTVYSVCGSGLTCGDDYVKVLQVAGNVVPDNKTPEPGSVALLGLGLFGIIAMRRRVQSSL